MAKQARSSIVSIDFSVFSPEEVKRFAVVNVTEPSMYSASLPVANGTADHRMGSVDRRLLCGTCRHGVNQCPGHYGMILLNYPVLHPSFLDVVLKLLKVTCFFCAELLLSDADRAQLGDGERAQRRAKSRKQRLVEAVALAKNKKACLKCAGPVPAYCKQGQVLRCDFSKAKFSDADEAQYCQRPFTTAEMRGILQALRDEDCVLLGFNPKVTRPENFVMTALVVPPPVVRPSVMLSEGSKARGQDDLTGKLCDIVKANGNVKAVLEREAGSIARVGLSLAAQQAAADLSFHVSTFINNDLRGQRQSVQRSGLPTRSIISRLKGKEGRIRGFLMGKRVDFSARSVISPDSQMDVDQVGVPAVVASRLTVPLFVLEDNLEEARRLVRDPGSSARSLCRGGACVVVLEFADREREAARLKPGDVVERTLQDDDIVLFNRQPSLHKGSMMGYRVLVCPGSRTFRLNLACTSVSNADYDGDEMNVHVPQDPAAQAEARLLMSVPEHIVSAQSNKPSVGLVQDALVAAWLLTSDGVAVTREQLCALHLALHYTERPLPAPLPEAVDGRAAFSLLLPPDLDYEHRGRGVLVRAGQLLAGRLCRQTLGTASGGLVHHLWLFRGPEAAKRFLSDAQRLLNRWLAWRGFSVRLSDCEPPAAVTERVHALVALSELKAARIAAAGERLHCAPMLEEAVATIANKALTDAGKVVHAGLDERENALYQDVASGAKGNLVNITQLMGLVGQQSVEGQRVDPGAPLTAGLARKGFVRRSYFRGLEAREFFAHTMAGREGLIDTSVKTASTGYLQRRLMKAMETLTVAYDRTCRNSRQSIVQFEYGGDGYDAAYLVRQSLDALRLTRAQLEAAATGAERPRLLEAWRRVLELRTRGRRRELELACYVPVPLDAMLRALPRGGGGLDAELHARAVDGLCERVCRLRHGRRLALELLLRWQLRAGAVADAEPGALRELLAMVEKTCLRAEVAPGEAVGPLASTSIGEPLTQLTLNSVEYDTELLLRVDGELRKVRIGDFAEARVARADALERHGDDTWLAWIRDALVEVLSCDEDGQISWRRVEAVTKHPVVNRDGSSTLLRVTTRAGRSVVATKGKSFLKRVDNKIVPVEGETLRVGDRLPASRVLPLDAELTHLDGPERRVPLDEAFGFLTGAYLAEGRIERITHEDAAFHRRMLRVLRGDVRALLALLFERHRREELLAAPKSFLKGLLGGYLSCDASPSPEGLTASSTSRQLLEFLRQALLRFDIQASVGGGPCEGDACTLTVGRARCTETFRLFLDVLGAGGAEDGAEDVVPDVVLGGRATTLRRDEVPRLLERLDSQEDRAVLLSVMKEEIVYDEVVALEEVENAHTHVYDLTVEGTRNFNLWNSLCMRDTFHSVRGSELQ